MVNQTKLAALRLEVVAARASQEFRHLEYGIPFVDMTPTNIHGFRNYMHLKCHPSNASRAVNIKLRSDKYGPKVDVQTMNESCPARGVQYELSCAFSLSLQYSMEGAI